VRTSSYNSKICLKEIRLEDVDWIQIDEDRIQAFGRNVMNFKKCHKRSGISFIK
jgi:hypothetical protein